MSAYGNQDANIAGGLFGSNPVISSLVVPSGASFAFGDAVCVDSGDASKAYKPDSTDTSLTFRGVAVASHRSYDSADDGSYIAYTDMNVLTGGEIYVVAASGLTNVANLPAYLVDLTSSGDYGKFTTVDTDNLATGGYFRSNVADGLVRIEL
jgi:hypothetical protein